MMERYGAYSLEDSPYIQELLTNLRDERTDSIEFRKTMVSLGRYMAYELTKTFNYGKVPVRTPLESTEGTKIFDLDKITIVVVLRAAIPFMEGVIKVFEKARVGIVSASRGAPPDFDIEMNYVRIPKIDENTLLIVLDPMIATGSTLTKVLDRCVMHEKPARKIIMGIIAAPQGIEHIKSKHDDAEIYVAAVDRTLNEKGYILPGLGDAGDRAFHTKFE